MASVVLRALTSMAFAASCVLLWRNGQTFPAVLCAAAAGVSAWRAAHAARNRHVSDSNQI